MVHVKVYGRKQRWVWGVMITAIMIGLVQGCAKGPPGSVENICHIFRDRPEWHLHLNSERLQSGGR